MQTILEEICTVREACLSEKICKTTVYKLINQGHYEAVKIGRCTRITLASLLAYRKKSK